MLKEFGWTYDYLLWGISWVNVELMIADQARTLDDKEAEEMNVEHRELKTKEDIMNYVKGLM